MKTKMTEFIAFRASPEVVKKLEALCTHQQESRSQVLIGLIIAEHARKKLEERNMKDEIIRILQGDGEN